MKLNWFSPLPPAKTDIAGYATRVLPTLGQSADIVAWTDQPQWDSEIEKYVEVRHYDSPELPWPEVNRADLNIYHIGNNPYFHRNIWEINRRCPGLVVLHDLKLHHFFEWIYHRQPNGREIYLTEMARYYGLSGREAGEKYWIDELSIDFMADHYPLTDLALENALGVITHTQESFDILQQVKYRPVAYIPLPYVSKYSQPLIVKSSCPPYQLIIFGYISTNRRLDSVFEALAGLPERDLFRLNIYGEIWDQNYLNSQIQKMGLHHLVTIHGFVDEIELDKALANSHLAINLRYPTMGEASGSQLRIWSHALPSLVTKIGWYASLPETAVIHISIENEVDEIQRSLRNFLAMPEAVLAMGSKGESILRTWHSSEMYSNQLMQFVEHLCRGACYGVTSKLVDNTSFHLQSWIGEEISKSELIRLAAGIHFITSSKS